MYTLRPDVCVKLVCSYARECVIIPRSAEVAPRVKGGRQRVAKSYVAVCQLDPKSQQRFSSVVARNILMRNRRKESPRREQVTMRRAIRWPVARLD